MKMVDRCGCPGAGMREQVRKGAEEGGVGGGRDGIRHGTAQTAGSASEAAEMAEVAEMAGYRLERARRTSVRLHE